jgi:signal peptidase II
MEKQHHLTQSNGLSRGYTRDLIFGGIAILVILADQFTKWLIRANLALGQVWWDGGFLEITHIQNDGVSFGLFKGHVEIIIVIVFIEMAVILGVVYFLRNRLSFLDNMVMRAGIGLVMGGAIGNQVDRIAQGYVTDFINFKVWPAFNTADASAVIGTIMIAYCLIFMSGLTKSKPKDE